MSDPSTKSIAEKLHLKKGQKVGLIGAPEGLLAKIGKLPDGTSVVNDSVEGASVVLIFVLDMKELESRIKTIRSALGSGVTVWVSYPKGTSGVPTDLNRDIIWHRLEKDGVTAVSNFSIDEVWSALRLKLV